MAYYNSYIPVRMSSLIYKINNNLFFFHGSAGEWTIQKISPQKMYVWFKYDINFVSVHMYRFTFLIAKLYKLTIQYIISSTKEKNNHVQEFGSQSHHDRSPEWFFGTGLDILQQPPGLELWVARASYNPI